MKKIVYLIIYIHTTNREWLKLIFSKEYEEYIKDINLIFLKLKNLIYIFWSKEGNEVAGFFVFSQ